MLPSDVDLTDQLALYVLGCLEAGQAREIEIRAERDLQLQEQIRATQETCRVMASCFPPLRGRERLLQSVGAPAPLRFASAFARIFDVSVDEAQKLILAAGRSPWREYAQGCLVQSFTAGPACEGTHTGFICVAPGTKFPRRPAPQLSLTLAGSCLVSGGTVLRPGTEYLLNPSLEADFIAGPAEAYLFAVRSFDRDLIALSN